MCAFQAEIIFLHLFIFHKAELFRMFKILETLIMTWSVEEYCLEINVILIQQMSLTLQWNFDKAGMVYSGHLGITSTFA